MIPDSSVQQAKCVCLQAITNRYNTYAKFATQELTGADVNHLSCLSRQAVPMLYAMIMHEVQIMLGCCP